MRVTSPWSKVAFLIWSLANCSALSHAQRPWRSAMRKHFGFDSSDLALETGVASIAGGSGDPSTYYAGAASGGVWKTTDGGNRWEPMFDKEPAADRSDRRGSLRSEHHLGGKRRGLGVRDSDVMGNGVYLSTDSGKTWVHVGLDETGRIGRILVDPKNPDAAFVWRARPRHGTATRTRRLPHD